jgi:hypothetical protein
MALSTLNQPQAGKGYRKQKMKILNSNNLLSNTAI